tara:strand:- start:29 stop:175 length:147 start_codon:yes stop_codon:yes gene_type:complete
MTRKHFVAIADILKKHEASDDMIKDFSFLFIDENPLFDMPRFFKACKE